MGSGHFQGENFLVFCTPVVFVGQGDLAVHVGGDISGSGALSPLQDGLQGAALEADVVLVQPACQSVLAGCQQRGRRAELTHQGEGQFALPDVAEAGGEAGQGGIEMFADLAAQRRRFLHEAAAMTDQQLQGAPKRIDVRLAQGEAIDGGTMDGGQVGVIGFGVGIGRLTKLFGGVGMNRTSIEGSGGKSILNGVMIAAGAFDRDKQIGKLILLHRVAHLSDSGVQLDAVMVDERRRQQHFAIEVAKHPFGTHLGAIDADDTEMFGADLLYSGLNDATWFLQKLRGFFGGA
jgi:hypothetical protein